MMDTHISIVLYDVNAENDREFIDALIRFLRTGQPWSDDPDFRLELGIKARPPSQRPKRDSPTPS